MATAHMTFSVPPELKQRAQQRKDINWSGFVATAIEGRLTSMQEVDAREAGQPIPTIHGKEGLIKAVAEKHGVRDVRVFGSVARGEAKPGSDLDLLVTLDNKRTYFDLFTFEAELSEVLGFKVEATTENGLRVEVKDEVLAQAVPL